MGVPCCKLNRIQDSKLQLQLNDDNEPEKLLSCTLKYVNKVKVIHVHDSRLSSRLKLKHPASTGVYNESLEKKVFINNEEKKWLLSVGDMKIEPKFFRNEKRKESLENNYKIEELIGTGSYGVVRKIKCKITGEYRALKIFSKKEYQKTDNFADEIRNIKMLVTYT
jgi:hypothetical protein